MKKVVHAQLNDLQTRSRACTKAAAQDVDDLGGKFARSAQLLQHSFDADVDASIAG